MNNEHINGTGYEDLQKAQIMSQFNNSSEILKSEHQLEFEESINKGEIEVISLEDVTESYNDTFFAKSDIDKFEGQLEELIKKGEDEYLDESEYEALVDGRNDVDSLLCKAVALDNGGYAEVYVRPASKE